MNRNVKIAVEIYSNICPIFLWINEMKKKLSKNDPFRNEVVYKLLKEMRNKASHLYIYNVKNIKQLFINMVLVYKKFGINLIDKFQNVRKIWNKLQEDKSVDCNRSINYDNRYRDHYDLLKNILIKYFDSNDNLLTCIYKFGSPIIIWNAIITRDKDSDIKKSILFNLTHEIKNKLCHSFNKISEMLKSIVVIYQSFGLDLVKYNLKIRNYNFDDTKLVKNYREIDIKLDIRKIISDKSNKSRKYYFSFGTLLHHIVASYLLENKSILHEFTKRENYLEWDDNSKSFIRQFDNKEEKSESTEALELHFTDESICVTLLKTVLKIFMIFVIFMILLSVYFRDK